MHRVIRRTLIIISVLVLLFFPARHFLVASAFNRISSKLESKGFHLSVARREISGLNGVRLYGLTLTPASGDTLLRADSIYVEPSLMNLFIWRLKLNELKVANANLHLSCLDSACNYSSLREKTETDTEQEQKINYMQLAKQVFKNFFNAMPGEMLLNNINVRVDKDSVHEDISVPFFETTNGNLHGMLTDNKTSARWNMTGMFSVHNRTFDIKIFSGNETPKGLPLVKSFFGAYCNVDSLQIILSENSSGSPWRCRGVMHAFNVQVIHPKLSGDTVHVDDFTNMFSVSVGKDFIELDSSSYVQVNKLPLMIYARINKNQEKVYSLVMKTGQQDADNFFTSLPEGMFSELHDLSADGTLDFTLRFHLDSEEPDSVSFDSHMEKKNFHLKKYGDLLKLNGEFPYTAYENDRPVATFTVGLDSPDFVLLEKISPYLRNAILTSEDGSFFFHNGFNEDAFRKSIAANYKAGKFVRGGSTITMQLVKNVFLTRHKTIARKAEEAFLVWLIENNRLCSKERMFEVYLNIIELGPGIYGVKKASLYYFDKLPGELTLSESIFLASLLPHPKWFKYSFDTTGNLKPYLVDYYRVVSNFMLKKNLITEAEYNSIEPRVELKGPAKEIVVPSDTIPGEYPEESPD